MTTVEQRYPPKVQAALRHLDAAGVQRRHSAPPLHRLLWRTGVNAPPPIIASVASNALLMGIWFALGWGVLMWRIVRSADGGRDARHAPAPWSAVVA